MSEEKQIKVLFIEVTKEDLTRLVPYQADKHLGKARKFLYWTDSDSPGTGLLVVGANHSKLHYHKEVCKAFKEHYSLSETQELVGAGTFEFDGVGYWHSVDFGIKTPEELKPLILKALGISR